MNGTGRSERLAVLVGFSVLMHDSGIHDVKKRKLYTTWLVDHAGTERFYGERVAVDLSRLCAVVGSHDVTKSSDIAEVGSEHFAGKEFGVGVRGSVGLVRAGGSGCNERKARDKGDGSECRSEADSCGVVAFPDWLPSARDVLCEHDWYLPDPVRKRKLTRQ